MKILRWFDGELDATFVWESVREFQFASSFRRLRANVLSKSVFAKKNTREVGISRFV